MATQVRINLPMHQFPAQDGTLPLSISRILAAMMLFPALLHLLTTAKQTVKVRTVSSQGHFIFNVVIQVFSFGNTSFFFTMPVVQRTHLHFCSLVIWFNLLENFSFVENMGALASLGHTSQCVQKTLFIQISRGCLLSLN